MKNVKRNYRHFLIVFFELVTIFSAQNTLDYLLPLVTSILGPKLSVYWEKLPKCFSDPRAMHID